MAFQINWGAESVKGTALIARIRTCTCFALGMVRFVEKEHSAKQDSIGYL